MALAIRKVGTAPPVHMAKDVKGQRYEMRCGKVIMRKGMEPIKYTVWERDVTCREGCKL